MKDQFKTKQALIQELASLRQRIAQLEESESERKRAEETLRENKQRYNAIFDCSLDCIYVVDFDGNFIDANPTALTLLGYELTDIRPLNIFSLLDERDLSKGLKDFSEIIQVGFQKEVGEYRLRCKDGRYITVENKASVIYHDDKPPSIIGIARDITNRKQVDEDLKESSGRYKELSTFFESLFNAIPDVLGIQDHQHGIIRYNQAGYDFLGRSQEEVEGKKCFQLINRTKRCEICATSEVYKTKEPARVEKYIEEMGVWLDCRSYPVFDEGGNLVNIIEHLRDITEQKQAENALKKSEERLRLITDNMSDMIRVTDLKGVNIFVSPSHLKGLGYKLEEREGKSVFEIVHPDDLEKVIKTFSEGLAAKRRTTAEYRVRHADGHYIWLDTVGDVLLDAQGDITAIVMSSRDVTQRRHVEEEIQKANTLLNSIIENIPDMIFLKEAGELRFVRFNRAGEDLLGYSRNDLLGKNDYDFFPKEHADFFTQKDREVLRRKEILDIQEEPIQTLGKGERILHTKKVPILNTNGDPEYLLGISEDITDRKKAKAEREKLQAQLTRAQKLESIGTLAGGIAHDFNNLLMAIQGHASLMMLGLDPSDSRNVRLKHIEELIRSGADLSGQLLGFAQGGRYNVKPISMNDIVEKSSVMFGRTKKEINIHRKYAKGPCVVEADQSQMGQVFMNLFVNAWQAMPEGGDIFVETEEVVLDEIPSMFGHVSPGRYVKVTITDTGTGMDAQTKERIFDPFFTTKGMGRGTGLGLATVYGIIQGHGGMITVESEPGQGSSFILYLPSSEKDLANDKDSIERPVRGTESILLVDDENMVLDVSRELLASLQYKVYTAGRGEEAVAIYMERKGEIDLVILDMVMPGMSGGETFDRLREINPEVKVLLASGYSIDGQAQQIMDRGCDGFIKKPFRLAELSQQIRKVLD